MKMRNLLLGHLVGVAALLHGNIDVLNRDLQEFLKRNNVYIDYNARRVINDLPKNAQLLCDVDQNKKLKILGVTDKKRRVESFRLITPSRFDVIAKYIYGMFYAKKITSGWGLALYEAHMRAINGLHEAYPAKNGIADFLNAYHAILDSIKARGFDPQVSSIPVDACGNICNGAHRTAACLLYKQKASITYYGTPIIAPQLLASTLKKKGLDDEYLDAMALKYVELKPNTHIAILFPAGLQAGRDNAVENTRMFLSKYGNVVYERELEIAKHGPFNLVKHLYEGHHWLGDWDNNFAGVKNKMRRCFPSSDDIHKMVVFIVENDDLQNLLVCKEKIRDYFGVGNDSIHMTDTAQEAITLGQMLFVPQSRHFLQNADQKKLEHFEAFLPRYTELLANESDPSSFCIDSSAVLAAYGLRDCADIDYLHHANGLPRLSDRVVESHNYLYREYDMNIDDIIFNPNNHFYYKGVKFAGLHIVKHIKQLRGEEKDKRDVALIDTILAHE